MSYFLQLGIFEIISKIFNILELFKLLIKCKLIHYAVQNKFKNAVTFLNEQICPNKNICLSKFVMPLKILDFFVEFRQLDNSCGYFVNELTLVLFGTFDQTVLIMM